MKWIVNIAAQQKNTELQFLDKKFRGELPVFDFIYKLPLPDCCRQSADFPLEKDPFLH
jgi:hypothetical protein